MKQQIFRVFGTLVLAGLMGSFLASCDLTRMPSKSIPIDESLKTYEDAAKWNRGVYTQFRNRQGGVFVTIQEQMSDYLNASSEFGNRGGVHHGWVEMSASDNDVATVYAYYYSALKNLNSLINGGYQGVIDDIEAEKAGTTNEKTLKTYEAQMGEIKSFIGSAYFARAYYYFNLLWRFGTPYNKATASTDLGVPVVTVYNVSDQVKRGTVQQGYDLIFADLKEAEKYLTDVPNESGSIRFNTDAITALRARAYLEMKDYENAYSEAMKLISSGRYPLIDPTEDAIMDLWRHDTSTEFILMVPLRAGTETVSSMGSYYAAYKDQTYHTPDWIPTQGLLDKFAPEDIRRKAYFEEVELYYNNIHFDGMTIVSKFRGNPEFATDENEYYGPIPNGQQMPKIFRIAEDYLIAAEAAYFSNKDALTPLNELRRHRGLAPLSGISGKALLDEIKDERLRELAFEGFRLFDLRRWGDPMNRMTSQKTTDGSTLFLSNSDFRTLKIEAGNPKFVFPIPQWDINVYGEENMPQNPGW